ncbi:MAG: hypothetical protein JO267_15320 [Alphaproteobacteria bacterium]|nr:hypothetical protein [Alphaproteobacteria bacterium]
MTIPATASAGLPSDRSFSRPHAKRRSARLWQVAVLLCVLPLIFQSFHYVVDVRPLYLLSKIMPMVLAPFAVAAFLFGRLPYRGWFVALGLYALLVTPILSAINFGEGGVAALSTQIKLLPISYYFSFFAVLWLLRPSYDELVRSVVLLALVSLALFPLLWAVTPEWTYYQSDEETKVFLYDPERGFRIVVPPFFVEIFIFYQNRRFWATRRPLCLVLVACSFVMLLLFYKERTTIAGLFAVVLFAALAGQSLSRKAVLCVVMAALAGIAVGIGIFSNLSESGSLTVRQGTIAIALAALNHEPIGWLIGLGTVSHFREESFIQLYGHTFFLADIGVLGIIYEYGVVGCLLFAAIYVKILQYFRTRLAFTEDPFLFAFRDQIRFQILTAIILPITYAPAEWAATLGLFVYFRRRIEERLQPRLG